MHGTATGAHPTEALSIEAALLPRARLLTVENAAHTLWVQAAQEVMPSIQDSLSSLSHSPCPTLSRGLRINSPAVWYQRTP